MNRRKKLQLTLAASILAVALVALLVWRSEPRYGGRSLTDWAIDAQNGERLAQTDSPDYLAARDAIHQMGPAAAETAVDWLENESRWERNRLLNWIGGFLPQWDEPPRLNRTEAAAMILRLVNEDARARVESGLISMLAGSTDGFTRQVGVLTNFSASTWTKVEPLLLHTNPIVRRQAASLALVWPRELKVNLETVWRSRADERFMGEWSLLEQLLLRHSTDTNRLATAIGTNFIWITGDSGSSTFVPFGRANNLAKLGAAGQVYLKAGLNNDDMAVRQASRVHLNP